MVKCIICGKVISGGAHRMKKHTGQISGNVAACLKATSEAQANCRNAIIEVKSKGGWGKKMEELLLRSQVNVVDITEEEDVMEELEVRRDPHSLGPLDRFVSGINPDTSLSGATKRQ
ncbi:hypothetical protein ACOSQ4_010074 [Xanthoceras sorbifolium]